MSEDGIEQSRCTRYCEDCDDETRHRQVGDDSYECLACHERIEIKAALGIDGGESGR